jgi:hypothetical protein
MAEEAEGRRMRLGPRPVMVNPYAPDHILRDCHTSEPHRHDMIAGVLILCNPLDVTKASLCTPGCEWDGSGPQSSKKRFFETSPAGGT